MSMTQSPSPPSNTIESNTIEEFPLTYAVILTWNKSWHVIISSWRWQPLVSAIDFTSCWFLCQRRWQSHKAWRRYGSSLAVFCFATWISSVVTLAGKNLTFTFRGVSSRFQIKRNVSFVPANRRINRIISFSHKFSKFSNFYNGNADCWAIISLK